MQESSAKNCSHRPALFSATASGPGAGKVAGDDWRSGSFNLLRSRKPKTPPPATRPSHSIAISPPPALLQTEHADRLRAEVQVYDAEEVAQESKRSQADRGAPGQAGTTSDFFLAHRDPSFRSQGEKNFNLSPHARADSGRKPYASSPPFPFAQRAQYCGGAREWNSHPFQRHFFMRGKKKRVSESSRCFPHLPLTLFHKLRTFSERAPPPCPPA